MIIETNMLTKKYDKDIVVSDVNLNVKEGRIYGLLGRNGAGKTTIMKMILGLTSITSGQIEIMGKPLKNNEKEILSQIGVLIESPGFYPNLTGTENLKIFAKLRKIENIGVIKKSLDLVGLGYKDKKLFREYSLGMKQRLAIALAIMHNPKILILDEPINGLDPIGISEIRAFIKRLCEEEGKTILLSSHILSEISMIADDIGIIDKGKLLEEGSIEELKNRSKKHVEFIVSDVDKSINILTKSFANYDFIRIDKDKFKLNDLSLETNKAIDILVNNNINIYDVHTYEETLEEYFKRVTGGVGIA